MTKKLIIASFFLLGAIPSRASTPVRKMLMAEVSYHGTIEVGPINFSIQQLDPNQPSGEYYEVVTEFKTSNLEVLQHQTRISSEDIESNIRVFWQ